MACIFLLKMEVSTKANGSMTSGKERASTHLSQELTMKVIGRRRRDTGRAICTKMTLTIILDSGTTISSMVKVFR